MVFGTKNSTRRSNELCENAIYPWHRQLIRARETLIDVHEGDFSVRFNSRYPDDVIGWKEENEGGAKAGKSSSIVWPHKVWWLCRCENCFIGRRMLGKLGSPTREDLVVEKLHHIYLFASLLPLWESTWGMRRAKFMAELFVNDLNVDVTCNGCTKFVRVHSLNCTQDEVDLS